MKFLTKRTTQIEFEQIGRYVDSPLLELIENLEVKPDDAGRRKIARTECALATSRLGSKSLTNARYF